MEKRVVLAIVVCAGIAVGWFFLFRPKPPAPTPLREGTPTPAAVEPAPAPQAQPPVPQPDPPKPEAPQPDPAKPDPAKPEPVIGASTVVLEDALRHLELSSQGGLSVLNFESWDCPYHAPGDRSVPGDPGIVSIAPVGHPGALSVKLLGEPGTTGLDLEQWHVEKTGPETVQGAHGWIQRGGVRIDVTLAPGGPHDYTFKVRVTNLSLHAGAERILVVRGPWTPRSLAHIPEDGLLLADAGDPVQIRPEEADKELKEHPDGERHPEKGAWRWIATRADFHLGALVPVKPLPEGTVVTLRDVWLSPAEGRPAPDWISASAALQAPFKVPAVGASEEFEFMFYAGPNSRSVLTTPAYQNLADAYINRTFLKMSFGPIGRALGWLLQTFASTGMGYGFAVLCLTLLVRGCLFPLSRKSQLSMKMHSLKMARIKPKLDAVREKYKDKPKQLNAETMKVMREEKMQILPAGCLLAFLQMPIWISLYATLQTHFDMRHAPFLWIKDLTAPDHLAALPWAQGWPVLNGWFNLLPLLMVATWWGSSAMQPLPDDPEQRQQAKIMRWIPLLFGFFMYSTASGLTLYMTLSALWSIGESWLIRKVWLSKLEIQPAVEIISPPSRRMPSKR